MSTFCSPITRSIVPVQYLLTFFHPHVYTPLDHYRCFYYLRTHCCSGVYLSSMRKHFINWSLCHVNELEKLSFLMHIKIILKSCGVLKFGTFSRVVSQDCTQKLQIFINEEMSDEMLINWYSSWSKFSHDAFIAESENGKKNIHATNRHCHKKEIYFLHKCFVKKSCNNENLKTSILRYGTENFFCKHRSGVDMFVHTREQ